MTSKAQARHVSMDSVVTHLEFKELLADETWLTYLKTGAKIVTSSEDIFQKISLKWGDEFKSINITYKKDRHGRYKQYSIYCSEQTGNNIRQWAKKNL